MNDLATQPVEPAPAATTPVVLEARGLVRRYRMGGKTLQILDGADLTLHQGETLAVMGRSGSGKSTLLHLLGLLDRPDEGQLDVAGQQTVGLGRGARARLRNREIGFVFQFYHLIPELSALGNAVLPAMIDHGPLAWWSARRQVIGRARELLGELGLGDRLGHKPAQLSGGERQRVAIARALCTRPSLLLADEPTGNLDEATSEAISARLFDLVSAHGTSLIMVTHDPELARAADRVLHLHDGRLVTETSA